MKNLFRRIKCVLNTIKKSAVSIAAKTKRLICLAKLSAQVTLASNTAEGYVDTGVKILIAVVLGALLLAGLYTLFNSTIMPTVTQRVTSLFNYTGA